MSATPPRPKPDAPATKRVDVAGVRREQIIEAAVAIMVERGIQALSLSEIEARTGMSRGQLTYYFAAKDDILLAVFDRMVRMMRERVAPPGHTAADLPPLDAGPWERAQFILHRLVQSQLPREFARLQYTFLAQLGHRADFRDRLADLYGEWRREMADGIAGPHATPAERDHATVVSSYFQAILHGLVMQLEADEAAFPRQAMLDFLTARLRPLMDPTWLPH